MCAYGCVDVRVCTCMHTGVCWKCPCMRDVGVCACVCMEVCAGGVPVCVHLLIDVHRGTCVCMCTFVYKHGWPVCAYVCTYGCAMDVCVCVNMRCAQVWPRCTCVHMGVPWLCARVHMCIAHRHVRVHMCAYGRPLGVCACAHVHRARAWPGCMCPDRGLCLAAELGQGLSSHDLPRRACAPPRVGVRVGVQSPACL